MEAAEYQALARFEERYWWYRAVRELLLETVNELELSAGARPVERERLVEPVCRIGRRASVR